MNISSISFANLKRRKGKSAFLAMGIALGIGTVVALLTLSGSIRKEIGAQLDQFGANIVVLPKSDSLALNYGGISVSSVSFDAQELKTEDVAAIREIPYRNRLSVVAPKLLGTVDVEAQQVLLAGVDFVSELKLKRWWQIEGQAPRDEQEVLIGYDVARILGLIEGGAPSSHHAHHVHHASSAPSSPSGGHDRAASSQDIKIVRDRIQIAGTDHRVTGVIALTGGPEDRMIFSPLNHVQSLLKRPGRLSLIEVSALCKDCPVDDMVAQIGTQLPHAKAAAVQQSVRAREQAVDRLSRFSAAVSAVVLAIGALLIFTTMTGSVVERTKEIGVLRAIGFRRMHIIRSLVIEVGAISLVGGIAGWAMGTLVSWIALPYFADTMSSFELRLLVIPASIAGAVIIGVASSFYPILRASRLDPSEAVRYV